MMLRKNAILILILLAVSALFGAGAEDEILAAEKRWAEAVIARDFAALEKIYHEHLIYAHSSGVIETKAQYLAKLRSGKQKYDVIDHHKTTVRAHGDSAVAHSIVTMKGTNPVGPFDNKLMMIHMWVKDSGRWQLAAHQTTELKE